MSMHVWFRVLSTNFAIAMGWIIFYEPVINQLLPLAAAAPGVPPGVETNFLVFWYFWPIALMFATVVLGILASGQKDYYEVESYDYGGF